ncbi:zinc finger MYND domain-containing protein [Phanerochaete sordida]|uniref:Zinc finger MYND domain-containing protein n=1 Tax=Phanerochaete sordida TaxID=48140 RepID=A0A9P3G7Z5_9APHY|nr:zinc finger MYND domain-containing protein [Phanerochaete sordida]
MDDPLCLTAIFTCDVRAPCIACSSQNWDRSHVVEARSHTGFVQMQQGEAFDTTAERLVSSPHIWTSIIRGLRRSKTLPSPPELDAIRILPHAVDNCDDADWTVAWDHGFVTAVAELVSYDGICGLTSEELASAQGPDVDTMRFISAMMDILRTSLDRFFTTPWRGDDETERLLEILQSKIIPMFDNLWEIRTPFLVSELAYTQTDPIAVTLHESLCFLAMALAVILKFYRDVDIMKTNSRIAHVLLLIWMYSPDREVRCQSLRRIVGTADEAHQTSFFLSVSHGCTDRDRISASVLRDLKDEHILNEDLLSSFECADIFSNLEPEDGGPVVHWEEPLLIPYGLAAARRQLCLGTNYDNLCIKISSIAFGLSHDQKFDLPRMGKRVYELLGLLCRFVKDVIAEEEPETLDLLLDALWWLVPLLQTHPLDPGNNRPKELAIRRLTYNLWRETTDDLNRRRLVLRSQEWKEFARVWRGVGRAIPDVPEGEASESPFEPLARCAWGGCLCSVHKPKHRMRVCKGCWVVAYCGTKCQTSDWQDRHRWRCRNNLE